MFDFLSDLFGFGNTFSRSYVRSETSDKIKLEWQRVNTALTTKNPAQLRQALISADKCLDNALKDVFPGETMGERLKNARDKYDRTIYNKIWEAHKVRNSLVHEAGYEPPYYVLTEAINNLRNGLMVLGVRF